LKSIRCSLVCAVICLVGAGIAHGQEDLAHAPKRPVVVLVGMETCCVERAWPAAEQSTLAELENLALEVEMFEGSATGEGEQPLELQAIAEARDATCVVRIYKKADGSGSVDLWTIDPGSSETTFKHLPVEGALDGEAATVVTLRIVEAIRVGLLEKWHVQKKGSEEKAAVAKEVEPIEPKSEPIPEPASEPVETENPSDKTGETSPGFIGLGAGVAGGPGAVGTLWTARLNAGWRPWSFFAIEADGVISFAGPDIDSRDSRASFNLALVRGWIAWEILDKARLRPSLGIGAGAAFVWTEGLRSEFGSIQSDSSVVTYLGGMGRLGIVITRYLWIRLALNVGGLLPEVRVMFDEQEAAVLGKTLIEGLMSFEVNFP
jgi:hypothetical protein